MADCLTKLLHARIILTSQAAKLIEHFPLSHQEKAHSMLSHQTQGTGRAHHTINQVNRAWNAHDSWSSTTVVLYL